MKSPFKFLDSYTKDDRNIFFGRDRETEELYHRVFESKIMLVYGVSGTGKSSLIHCGLANKFSETDWLPVNVRRAGDIVSSMASANRVRIERMVLANARQAIEGPCNVSCIEVEGGFAEEMLEKLNPGSAEVELTYLQVFLDKVYRLALIESDNNPPLFHRGLLEKTGNVSDLLGSFLDEQIDLLPDPGTALAVLKSFVSVKGTKRQMTQWEISDYAQTLGKPIDDSALRELIQTLIQLRILRDKDQKDRYELRHDALATKIYEKITLVEKELLEIRQLIENAYTNWEKRGVLLSAGDLDYIAPYESRLYLSKELDELLENSKRSLARVKRRKRSIAFAAMVALLIVFAVFTWWAMAERKAATENYIRARANNFLFLSQKVAENDPALALRLAEYAYHLDPGNNDIYSNINRIYYDNNFYRIILRDDISSMAVSSDGERILTGHPDGVIRLWDRQGNTIRVFRGHADYINCATFSPDGKYIISGSWDWSARLWDTNGNLLRIFSVDATVFSVVFSPCGQYILAALGDETARILDLQGNLVQVFTGHQDVVFSACFSPDGNNVLTGSGDKTARIWDLLGNTLQFFIGHNDRVLSAVFSPDGTHIITGSQDQTARLWQVKEPYELFHPRNEYEQLSIVQKIEYGIIDFSDVQRLRDEEEVFLAAGYYQNAAGLVSIEKREEYLRYAHILFGRLKKHADRADYILGAIQLYNSFDEISPSAKYRKESEKLFNRLRSINDPDELKKGADYFFSLAENSHDRETSVEYYSQCILLYENIHSQFRETGIQHNLFYAFNNISLDLLFERRFEEALAMAEKGLALKEEDIIFTKIALALLYNNRIDEAIVVVAEYRDAEVHNMSFKEYILNKMTELEEAGIIHFDHERVTELIKNL